MPQTASRVVIASVLVTAGATLPMFLVAASAVQIQEELNFGQAGLGFVSGSFTLGVTLFAWYAGRIADRIGGSLAMQIGVGFTGMVAFVIGFSGSRLSLPLLALLIGAAGIGNAIAQPAAGALLLQQTKSHRLGLAFGIFQSSKPVALLASGITVPLIALTFGWRSSFVVAGVVALLAMFFPPKMELNALRPDANVQNRTKLSPKEAAILAWGLVFSFGAADMLTTFMVDSAVTKGISPIAASLLLSIAAVMSIAARLYLGHRADSRPRAPLHTISAMLAVGALATLTMGVGEQSWIFAVATIVASLTILGVPGLVYLSLVRLHSHAPGTIGGIGLSAGSFGGIVGPVSFGFVAENVSVRSAWILCSGWAFVGAVLLFGAGRKGSSLGA